jgi:uncharacterized protein (TIGR02145 family)
LNNKLLLTISILSFVLIAELILFSGCRKNDNESSSLVYDICGNAYHVVTIGTQDWLKENLKTTKYQTGDPIEDYSDSIKWAGSRIGAYSFFNNDPNNSDLYGVLYNWFAVHDNRNIAPAGWHVATADDWRLLIEYLGDDSTTGSKLKEVGTNHWYPPNSDATNESGFTALPGGYRSSKSEFRDLKSYGSWWSSTEFTDGLVWRFGLVYNSGSVNSATRTKKFGYSVRCVRNNILAGSIPIVTTNELSEISFTTAVCGGNVVSDGGAPVTARGVCWSTYPYPTIVDFITSDGSGLDSFTSNISSLVTNKTYYLRAYATNSNGTGYGKIVKFLAQGVPTGTVTDIEGNTYITVTIGTQLWMAENLKTIKYKNGTAIPEATDQFMWGSLTSPGYCWFSYNEHYKELYGALYNWYTINTGNLCPTGWHVPSDDDWTTLITYLGGPYVAGGKLKATGTMNWSSPNTGATNETGFTALPSGFINSDGYLTLTNGIGHWWSSTESSDLNGGCYFMTSASSNIPRKQIAKKEGIGVRCIKDN